MWLNLILSTGTTLLTSRSCTVIPRGDDNEHLQWLQDILITYACFQPEVGYAQGMNDVLSMMLVVLDDEVSGAGHGVPDGCLSGWLTPVYCLQATAYLCFKKHMARLQQEITSEGMVDKLDGLKQLLLFMNPDLHDHFQAVDTGDMVFCHRWLLLSFKREFEEQDGLRMFEVLSSHYLEVSSLEADRERDLHIRQQRAKDLAGDEEGEEAEPASEAQMAEIMAVNERYTFELFVCVAILLSKEKELFACQDVADVFTIVNK